jgi:hypothetical protein
VAPVVLEVKTDAGQGQPERDRQEEGLPQRRRPKNEKAVSPPSQARRTAALRYMEGRSCRAQPVRWKYSSTRRLSS